jgi:hypothetical protein
MRYVVMVLTVVAVGCGSDDGGGGSVGSTSDTGVQSDAWGEHCFDDRDCPDSGYCHTEGGYDGDCRKGEAPPGPSTGDQDFPDHP